MMKQKTNSLTNMTKSEKPEVPSRSLSESTVNKYFKNEEVKLEIPEDVIKKIEAMHTSPDMAVTTAFAEDQNSQSILNRMLNELLVDGSHCRTCLDKFGLFTVNQLAVEVPIAPGTSGKYGVQMNIIKADIYPPSAPYSLQLYPVHDEIGFNMSKTLGSLGNIFPDWLGHGGQLVRNHGVDIPIEKQNGKWSLAKDKISYVEEWVIRPYELDFKFSKTSAQATLGLELGCHFRWNLSNPSWKYALATNIASNTVGAAIGTAIASVSGLLKTTPVPFIQGGAMLGQVVGHALQLQFTKVKPDLVLFWAGATFGAVDVNQPIHGIGRATFYPRIWGHVVDKAWYPSLQQFEAVLNRAVQDVELTRMERGDLESSVSSHSSHSSVHYDTEL
ncbi:hypothetical protein DOH76_24115 [Salmonella enterica subsp. enterica serovar Oranienburg]|nr:hypothetical protein [Salmonella enterica subsp. enterica serovar Oranienburg]EEP1424128.1 hypothetical protein [Salmonella enterica]EIG8968334.1 hypothetical protein [Salmonella enterica]EJE9730161.1 hypothetical protein [Salmonella enterica]